MSTNGPTEPQAERLYSLIVRIRQEPTFPPLWLEHETCPLCGELVQSDGHGFIFQLDQIDQYQCPILPEGQTVSVWAS